MSIFDVTSPKINTTITAPIPNKILIRTLVPLYPANEVAELTKWSTNICREKMVKVCFPLFARKLPIFDASKSLPIHTKKRVPVTPVKKLSKMECPYIRMDILMGPFI